MSSTHKTVLLTGASSGIGYELAKLFARDRYTLILVARFPEALERVAHELREKYHTEVHTFASDLSDPSTPDKIDQYLQQHSVHVNILVNNAGFGNLGAFTTTDIKTHLEIIQVNINALIHLTHLLLPQMQERGEGKILNVASTAGFQPGPLMAVYYATKAFVLSFSEALRNELKGTGITVTTLCPGPTKTNFGRRAKVGHIPIFKTGISMDAKSVAEIGYNGMQRGKGIVIPGLPNKAGVFFVRLLPRNVIHYILKKVHSSSSQPFITLEYPEHSAGNNRHEYSCNPDSPFHFRQRDNAEIHPEKSRDKT